MKMPPLRSLTTTNALIALWLVLTCNVTFYEQLHQYTPFTGWRAFAFLGSAHVLLWAYIHLFLQLVTWGRLARPLLSWILLSSALAAYFVDVYGVSIDAGQIQNMMETDLREVVDLLGWHMAGYIVMLALPPLLWLWWRPLVKTTFWRSQGRRLAAILLSLGLIGGVAALFYADYASIFRNHREIRLVINPHNYINGLRGYYKSRSLVRKPLLPYGHDARRDPPASPGDKPRLLVYVVGETARAESFGIDGYARDTTPALAARDIINFPQVSACGTATAVSLPCLFSGYTRADYDAEVASHREGLLDIMQRAGYRVTWIDNNSGCKGACARVGNLAPLADRRKVWCEGDECLDDILVETLRDYLVKTPPQDQVIVLHQMGSHGPAYHKRYPARFRRFTPTCDGNELQRCSREQVVNTYDNTIAYTDHILASVIDVLKAQAGRYDTAFWYVSDHGESLGERGLYLHGAPYMFAPSQQTHVPMVAWLSPGWRTQLGARARCLQQRRVQELAHDNVFHSLLGLLDIRTSVRDPALDLTAPCAVSGG